MRTAPRQRTSKHRLAANRLSVACVLRRAVAARISSWLAVSRLARAPASRRRGLRRRPSAAGFFRLLWPSRRRPAAGFARALFGGGRRLRDALPRRPSSPARPASWPVSRFFAVAACRPAAAPAWPTRRFGSRSAALRVDLPAGSRGASRRIGIGREVGAQLVQQRAELDALRLGDGPFQPRHGAGRRVLVGHQIEHRAARPSCRRRWGWSVRPGPPGRRRPR